MTKQINPHSTAANNSVASRPMQLASVIPTLEGVYSIQQLADNLEKDPDNIFLFVRNNIKFLPVWGSHKGAFACLMDRCGGAFDQVALASALLSASGIESKIVIGTIRITAQEAGDWLGTNPTKHETSVRCFNKGFISAVPVAGTGPGAAVQIDVAHAWLKIKIAGTWHVFDPAFKPSVKTEGANLHTHMGYDGPAFAEICKPGFDVDSEFIDNVNVSGMNSELSTMASNLRDWITANDASLTDLIGGSSVVEQTESSRLSSLSYQTPGSSTVEYNYANLPDSFKAKLRVQYGKLTGGGFDIDFDLHSQDIAGKRLTLTFDASNHAELRLDGVLLKSTADPIVEDEDEEDTLNATLTVSSDSWDLALVGGTGKPLQQPHH